MTEPYADRLAAGKRFFAKIGIAENALPGLVCVKGDFHHEFDPRA
jgi:hypothetical protein